MSNGELSKNQQKILECIRSYISEKNLSPTVREICNHTGIKSTSTVHENLKILTDMGLVTYTPGTRRAISLSEAESSDNNIFRIPLVGNVAAGTPILAVDNIHEFYPLPRSFAYGASQNDLFMLCIKGDSMIEIGMYENDMIVVNRALSVVNGDIAVARVDGERATVKRFYREKNRIRLQPENSLMQPIYADFENVEIVGKVVGLIRRY